MGTVNSVEWILPPIASGAGDHGRLTPLGANLPFSFSRGIPSAVFYTGLMDRIGVLLPDPQKAIDNILVFGIPANVSAPTPALPIAVAEDRTGYAPGKRERQI